ncbi:MAG: 2-iminobutanoate/2-iminopropanoate deaminase [Acetobacterium sp.]|jgi:2-iminobutanoate/2-iminopropanoate deaminase|nr:2-iminobutanoate/2-iminopropanoate deaminase [Acetobacterium sp.]
MEKKVITAQNAPAALGPYSHGVMAGETLYISGQLGINPGSGELLEGLENQVRQGLDNLAAILEAAGMQKGQIVKTTLFIKNMADFSKINELYQAFFDGVAVYPARACVEVAALPKAALFEIEAIAVKA